MNNEYREQADIAEGSFFNTMSAMANIRLDALCSEWRTLFPKSSLKILFGNGTEFVYVNGDSVPFWRNHIPFAEGWDKKECWRYGFANCS